MRIQEKTRLERFWIAPRGFRVFQTTGGLRMNLWQRVALVAVLAVSVATAASANMLANPGFESGLAGWIPFGNVYWQTSSPPQFVPYEGNGLVSMFGNWSGPWNVSGFFQEFPTMAGDQWTMSCKSRFWSGDPMVGPGAPFNNWVVQKLAFFDASNAEIFAVESTVLDGTFLPDTWYDNAPIAGMAPAGTVKVQALVLFIQPAQDGGAAHIDYVDLTKQGAVPTESTTWGNIKSLYGE
jgi:hypothetical protein